METGFLCDYDNLTERWGRFILEPLEKGIGTVLGNSLRRVLLSQLDGSAITVVKIHGVPHEFAPIPGAVEDTLEVIRNLRGLKLKMSCPGPKTLCISAEGVVTGRALAVDDEVRVLNPDVKIVTLEPGAKFLAEIKVEKGVGFRQAQENNEGIGFINVDANFSPIQRVGYAVRELEEGMESLSIELATHGGISPIDAINKAAAILKSAFTESKFI